MLNIIFGSIIMVLGFLMVWKSEWLLNNFGRMGWFDEHLGTEGGSRLGYKLIGLALIFIGFMVFANLFGSFIT